MIQKAAEPNDNFISRAIETYKKVIPNPVAQALTLGGLTYGIGRLAWNPIVETIRSTGRIPGRKLTEMTDEEWDEAMDELKTDSKYKNWLPAAVALLPTAFSLWATNNPYQKWNGQFSWNAAPAIHKNTNIKSPGFDQVLPMTKSQSLHKSANDLFEYGGYVPEIDYSSTINARKAQSLFTNDPYLQNQQYVKNLGTSIVADAAITAGTNQPTLGNVFDSAVNKITDKLTFSGMASVGVKTMVSNGLARMFTGALGAVTELSPETRRNLIDTGTWAGAITSILD